MAKETRKVISIDTGQAQTSLKDLRKEMSELRDALLNLDAGTEEYDAVQKRLIKDQEKINSVMNATKKNVDALPGSYNALTKELAVVLKQWKSVNTEAARNELAKRAREINAELKSLDSSVGNFQRNVGDYSNSIKSAFAGVVRESKSVKDAVTGLGNIFKNFITSPQALLAAFAGLATAMAKNERAMAGIRSGFDRIGINLRGASDIIGFLGEKIGDLIALVGNWIKNDFQFYIKSINVLVNAGIKGINFLAEPFSNLISLVTGGLEKVLNLASKIPGIGKKMGDFANSVGGVKDKIKAWHIEEVDLSEGLGKIWDKLKDKIKGNSEDFANTYSALSRQLNQLKKDWEFARDDDSRNALGIQIQQIQEQMKEMEKSLHTLDKAEQDNSTESIALAGSYDELQKKLHTLETAWRAAATESERTEIGKDIIEVKRAMEEMNSSLNEAQNSVLLAAGSYKALRDELNNLTAKWEESNDEAEKAVLAEKIKETSKALEDMQKQLKDQNLEPEKIIALAGSYEALTEQLEQVRKEWAATNDEAKRNELAAQYKELEKQRESFAKQLKDESSSGDIAAGSYRQMTQSLRELQMQWETTADEAERDRLGKQISKLQGQIRDLDVTRGGVEGKLVVGIRNLAEELNDLAKPGGNAKNAIISLGKAMKALLANPVGLFIAAIAIALKKISDAFKSSETAMHNFEAGMAALQPGQIKMKEALQKVADVLSQIFGLIPKILKATKDAQLGIASVLNKIGLVSDEKLESIKKEMQASKDAIDQSVELARRRHKLEDDQLDADRERAKTEGEIARLRAEAADVRYKDQKKYESLLTQAKEMEKKMYDEELRLAKENLAIVEETNARKQHLTDEDKRTYNEAYINYENVRKKHFDKMRELDGRIAASERTTSKTIREEEDKTLEHQKAVLEQRIAVATEGTLKYYELRMEAEDIDWQIQEERLKKEKYTDDQIEAFRLAHAKRLADIQKEMNDRYKEDTVVEEESIDEADVLTQIKTINDAKLQLAVIYSEQYFQILKDQENAEWMQAEMKLQMEGYTNEQIELLRQEHYKKLDEIDKERTAVELENRWRIRESYIEMKDDAVDALATISDSFESLLESQLQTGRISEKEYEKRKKKLQAFQIAAIIAEQASAIFNVWAGYAKEVGSVNPETASATGPAAAVTLAALNTKSLVSAIAKTAALASTGASQIAAVKASGKSNSSSKMSAVATPDTAGMYTGMSYSRNVQTAREEEELNAPMKVYVLESDITDAQNRSKVRVAETTF